MRLHRYHHLVTVKSELAEGLPIPVEIRGKQPAIFADELIGKIRGVIKPTPAMLKPARILAGYSIIATRSDGIAWVLDINTLDSLAGTLA